MRPKGDINPDDTRTRFRQLHRFALFDSVSFVFNKSQSSLLYFDTDLLLTAFISKVSSCIAPKELVPKILGWIADPEPEEKAHYTIAYRRAIMSRRKYKLPWWYLVFLAQSNTTLGFHCRQRRINTPTQLAAAGGRTWKQRPSPAAFKSRTIRSPSQSNDDSMLGKASSITTANNPLNNESSSNKKIDFTQRQDLIRPVRVVEGMPDMVETFGTRTKTKPMPITGYNAAAIEEYYDHRPFQVGWRLNSLLFPMLGWYLRLLMDKAMNISDKTEVQRKRGEELRELIIQSKSVALIKSGQALSLRPDIMKNKIWANELGKLVDAVGTFPDLDAMNIIRDELVDLYPKLKRTRKAWKKQKNKVKKTGLSKVQRFVENDDVLSMFEFFNDGHAVASASVGQVSGHWVDDNGC